MGERNYGDSLVVVRTNQSVIDTDGYPKTELYFNEVDNGKCYRGIETTYETITELIDDREVERQIPTYTKKLVLEIDVDLITEIFNIK